MRPPGLALFSPLLKKSPAPLPPAGLGSSLLTPLKQASLTLPLGCRWLRLHAHFRHPHCSKAGDTRMATFSDPSPHSTPPALLMAISGHSSPQPPSRYTGRPVPDHLPLRASSRRVWSSPTSWEDSGIGILNTLSRGSQ